jgi:hypothetical protein
MISKFKGQLEEGCAYVIEKFMVASNDPNYKATGHKYKLNFMNSTNIFKVTVPEIPRYHFDFVASSEVLEATKEERLLGMLLNC